MPFPTHRYVEITGSDRLQAQKSSHRSKRKRRAIGRTKTATKSQRRGGRHKRIETFIRFLVGFSVVFWVVSLFRSLYINQTDDELIPNEKSSTESIRSAILYLFKNLPNQEAQDEISDAIAAQDGKGVITLVTQGGIDKLPRLLDLTARWQGPISFAICITVEEEINKLLDFVQHHEPIQKSVSFHILMEQRQLRLSQSNRYPINQLRNLALRNAKTEYVFLDDVDFIPSIGSHDTIAAQIEKFSLPPKTFWVLPAFERFKVSAENPNEPVTDVALVPKTKKDLLLAIEQKVVSPFHIYWPVGHGPTNYSKWWNATDLYPIQHAKWFEPYVICNKKDLPQYYNDFRGFGFNKLALFVESRYKGFNYAVLPNEFVVHMNHEGRTERRNHDSKAVLKEFEKYLQKTYGATEEELKELIPRFDPKGKLIE